jgi:hypothetical protein
LDVDRHANRAGQDLVERMLSPKLRSNRQLKVDCSLRRVVMAILRRSASLFWLRPGVDLKFNHGDTSPSCLQSHFGSSATPA